MLSNACRYYFSVKMIPLTRGQFALVDDEDFGFLSQHRWFFRKHRRSGYAVRTTKHGTIPMHREILNAPKGVLVDHRDRNGLNNQRANLRFASHVENRRNTGAQANSKSGLKGIRLTAKGFWQVEIHIGTFETKELAMAAYNDAATRYHGEFAYIHDVKEVFKDMNNSQKESNTGGNKSESLPYGRVGVDLAEWVKQITEYPPLETEVIVRKEDDLYRRLSISVPPEINALVSQRIKQLGLSRSHYIRLLVNADIAKK